MKLSTAFLMLASVTTAAAKTITGKNAAKVLRAARRVEEGQEEEQEGEYDYLGKYNLKLIGCKAGEQVRDPETGEYEYNAVVVRLCPSEFGCDSDATRGCGSGYGDFVVGINTFVDAYFEDQRDNMNWDDNFEVDRYAQCEEYEQEAAEDDQAQQNANQYFIGPTCVEDGVDIRLAVFEDEACTYESETAFETISNGWSLPYSSGGIVSTSCIDCMEVNENGEYEQREMCQQLYEESASKCEEKMEYYSYYGQNVQGCEYIAEMMPAKKSGGAGKIFGWIIFFALIIGLAFYIVWWRKSKLDQQRARDEEMSQPRLRWWQRIFRRRHH